MKLRLLLPLVGILLPQLATANDHNDGAVRGLRGIDGDLTAFYAWISPDGSKLELVLPWAPNADATTKFSDATVWAIRVASRPSVDSADAEELVVSCRFDVAQTVSCWAGDEEYVSGDASGEAGISSSSARLRVFAGLRNDPFFFNLAGFKTAAARLRPAIAAAAKDGAGCPAIDETERAAGAGALANGTDSLAGQNVLALVVELDLALATKGGPILALSASTHRRVGE